ncbi:hypothetical protein, partial [Thermophilibacter provencensis]|uniref:hypothetical protein n=1 Tax=Thermophilibacter provencensis TaxID=1852386 RepID=UPI003AA7BEB7
MRLARKKLERLHKTPIFLVALRDPADAHGIGHAAPGLGERRVDEGARPERGALARPRLNAKSHRAAGGVHGRDAHERRGEVDGLLSLPSQIGEGPARAQGLDGALDQGRLDRRRDELDLPARAVKPGLEGGVGAGDVGGARRRELGVRVLRHPS